MSDNPKELTAKYKRAGLFDQQRRLLLDNFRELETHANLLLKLKLLIEAKVKDDPLILMKNKGKMAALIQGEIINQHHAEAKSKPNGAAPSLLSIVDQDLREKIIDLPEFQNQLRMEIKDIQRKMLGVSDEDYQAQLKREQEEAQRRAKELQEKEERRRLERAEKERAKERLWEEKHMRKSASGHHRVMKPPRINVLGIKRDSYVPKPRSDSGAPKRDRDDDRGSSGDSRNPDRNKPKRNFMMY